MILRVVVIEVEGGGWRGGGGLNIGVQNGIWRQLKARGPVWGPTGPFLRSQHPKLKITDIGQPFVASPALQVPIQESHDHLMAPKCHSRLSQGLRKAATETRLLALEQGQQWNMIVYWASNPFLVKSWVWYCVCGSRVFSNPVTYITAVRINHFSKQWVVIYVRVGQQIIMIEKTNYNFKVLKAQNTLK